MDTRIEGTRSRVLSIPMRIEATSAGAVKIPLPPVRVPMDVKNIVYHVEVQLKKDANTQIGLELMTSPNGQMFASYKVLRATAVFDATPFMLYAATKTEVDGPFGEYVQLVLEIGGADQWAVVVVYEQMKV